MALSDEQLRSIRAYSQAVASETNRGNQLAAIFAVAEAARKDLIERMIADAGEKATIFHPDTSNRISLFGSHRERLTNWLSSYLPTEDTDQ